MLIEWETGPRASQIQMRWPLSTSTLLTLIVDHRFKEYEGDIDLLPATQNGFREGYRTNNNAFILRHCIDEAVAANKCLAAVFIDLKNAFPSTNLPTLWTKLYDAGARGPMMDWMRVLYSHMTYRVKADRQFSEAFQSLWGILAGDSFSPSLFDAFLHDFKPPTLPTDCMLRGTRQGTTPVGNLELADDITEFTQVDRHVPNLTILQEKVSYTEIEYFAERAFLELNASKTKSLLFGARGPPTSSLTLQNGLVNIELVEKYRYGGVFFSSSVGSGLFTPHYETQATRATNAGHTLFASEAYTGTMPVLAGLRVYRARMDCHLTYGCEVAIDINEKGLALLEKAQKGFLRRLLGLGPLSVTAPLFALTGIMPIRHRRIILALRYALYLLDQPPDTLVNKAFIDSLALYQRNKKCWIGNIITVLARLPDVPVVITPDTFETAAGIQTAIDAVADSCSQHIIKGLASSRLPLLHAPDWGIVPTNIQTTLKMRPYLRYVVVPAHRKALTCMLCSDHTLAVEMYRRVKCPKGYEIAPDNRPCRYCRAPTESEVHVLFLCNGLDDLVERREAFFTRASTISPQFTVHEITHNPVRSIHRFLDHRDLAPTFAKFVYDVMLMFPGPERRRGRKD
ncbi:hypothetical protein D9611_014482 [Ephemerocybe angulata]|uniref:Reverse transcriptase domain-containing protein n=1 Tax=Ephemerocybe angulata TaxID=980116 RepID=A0A8H5C3C9_9AGAR|nr:hypothetical protein D9611_014482 [Tulosesus angulatus]